MPLIPTASQTVGPFFNFALTADAALGAVAGPEAPGERIRLALRLLDGAGEPLRGDAMVEIWQAGADGQFAGAEETAGAGFRGFGRRETDTDGVCVFETVKPAAEPGSRGGAQAPHINLHVFARGLLRHLCTRVYFSGEPANSGDEALALVPAERRATLLAQPSPDEPGLWRLDIRLQGEGETVFFDV